MLLQRSVPQNTVISAPQRSRASSWEVLDDLLPHQLPILSQANQETVFIGRECVFYRLRLSGFSYSQVLVVPELQRPGVVFREVLGDFVPRHASHLFQLYQKSVLLSCEGFFWPLCLFSILSAQRFVVSRM